MKQKLSSNYGWLLVGLLAAILAAPNASVIKQATATLDPLVFNFFRFSLFALATLPVILFSIKRFTKTNLKYAISVGFFMFLATTSYVVAIKNSQASYVTIITLITPIVFMIYAVKLVHEKITARAVAGIALAASGAFMIVFLPIAIKQQGQFTFYPLATALALVNTLTFPLAIIYSKKAHQSGLPMMAVLGVSAQVIALLTGVIVLIFSDFQISNMQPSGWLAVIFSGLVVAFISRGLNVVSYERIGTAANGAIGYLETFLAILVPVIFLSENLSLELVIGGALILLGVYVTQHHKSPHHRHLQLFRHH